MPDLAHPPAICPARMAHLRCHSSRFLANWPNRLKWGLEISTNEPTLARNPSISSRGTQICPNIGRPRSGRLIFSHIQVPLELIDRFLAKVGSLIKISSPNVSRFGQLAKNRLGLGLRYPIFSGAYGGGMIEAPATRNPNAQAQSGR